MESLLTQPIYVQYFGEYQKKYKTFNCESSASIGDVVYLDTIENKVQVNIDNKNINPSIGIIIKKLTSTTAKVQLFGECSLVFSSLQKSKNVFLSSSGELTNDIPNDGFIQKIGFCLEDEKIFINIDYMRVRRNPF